jgi:glutamate decarboxylase
MPTFALNFSRPGAQVVAQYYTFLRLGFEGYRRVQQECRDVATYLSANIAKLGPFELITEGNELPVFAFKLQDSVTNFSVFDVSRALREHGWLVPAYTFPENREDLAALRVVVRNGFSRDLANLLLDDLARVVSQLEHQQSPAHDKPNAAFPTSGSTSNHMLPGGPEGCRSPPPGSEGLASRPPDDRRSGPARPFHPRVLKKHKGTDWRCSQTHREATIPQDWTEAERTNA